MNKIPAISAITLVAVIMGMSAMTPAMAGVTSSEESPACDALRDALDNGKKSPKAIEAIEKNLEKLGCDPPNPCGISPTVYFNIDC